MDYKARKELFVQDLQGSDLNTVSQLIISTVVCHGLWALTRKCTSRLGVPQSNGEEKSWLGFLIDFVLVCVPLLAFLTGSSSQVESINILGSIIILVRALAIRFNPKKNRPDKSAVEPTSLSNPKGKLLAYISIYRSSLMIMTCIAILAVDFHVFPRFYAKVETFGSSLMDLGVGTFVFSSGLVSGRGSKPSQNSGSSIKQDLITSLKKSIPLWVIGIIRLISVKLSNYQEHVTEYGVHWNFFLTLGCLPLPVAIIESFGAGTVLPGWSLAFIYQTVLSSTFLQDYILSPNRVMGDLVSMNREGICSLWGYVAIFLIGKDLGTTIFRTKSPRPLLVEFGERFVFYLGFFLTSYYFMGVPISRRLANFSYVSWVACINVFQLTGFYLVNRFLGIKQVSIVHQGINFNGLFVFLLANILTGLINMNIPTLDVTDHQAYLILIGYLFVLCGSAQTLLLLGWKLV